MQRLPEPKEKRRNDQVRRSSCKITKPVCSWQSGERMAPKKYGVTVGPISNEGFGPPSTPACQTAARNRRLRRDTASQTAETEQAMSRGGESAETDIRTLQSAPPVRYLNQVLPCREAHERGQKRLLPQWS